MDKVTEEFVRLTDHSVKIAILQPFPLEIINVFFYRRAQGEVDDDTDDSVIAQHWLWILYSFTFHWRKVILEHEVYTVVSCSLLRFDRNAKIINGLEGTAFLNLTRKFRHLIIS